MNPRSDFHMETPSIHAARWWQAEDSSQVFCRLCPRACLIRPGRTGFCGVRANIDGRLGSVAYGRPVSINVDPIEKKPLARFMPGSRTFSIGTFGCNLNCSFCQNDSLSRGHYDLKNLPRYFPPAEIVELALRHNCRSVSYTYNEPTVFAEYAIDTAVLAAGEGLKNVLVSNGFITPEAAADLYPVIDAANIDMKGFSEEFYRSLCGGSLKPVLASIKYLYELGKHVEITNLVIPGHNDGEALIREWFDWVEENLDKDVPLHFSAYHPACRMQVQRTPRETLIKIRQYGEERGFTAIFLGNI